MVCQTCVELFLLCQICRKGISKIRSYARTPEFLVSRGLQSPARSYRTRVKPEEDGDDSAKEEDEAMVAFMERMKAERERWKGKENG